MATIATTPITSLAQLDPEGLYTYADYMSWQFQERVELIRGRLFPMSPAPNLTHQRILGNFYGPMWQYFQQHTCQVFLAPFDVRLPVRGDKKISDHFARGLDK